MTDDSDAGGVQTSGPTDAGDGAPLALTRAALQDGALARLVAEGHPELRLLSEAQRDQSLRDILAQRPDHGEGIWLFAYGSLIWNPLITFSERRVARIDGWHRAFCLSTPIGRGTRDYPGLVLGLDRGGSCTGVVLRIPEHALEEELALVWRREMLSGAYQPRWLAVSDPDRPEAPFGSAIAFTIDPSSHAYARDLTEAQTVRRLATARGQLGSAAEYLFRTRDGLRGLGVHDALVERLADAVLRAQAVGAPGPDPQM